jgi:dethiobiotin synthetase
MLDSILTSKAFLDLATARGGLFVTGTDTDVGKTMVASAIVRGLVASGCRVGVYKPVASGGLAADGDADRLWQAAGRPLSLAAVCPQSFAAPISPPRSARAEGRVVDDRLLRDGMLPWREASGVVIVEGAGGLFSPLSESSLNVDLARDLGLPLVIVDAARLGAIGRTLATVEAARARGLTIAAVVLSETIPTAVAGSGVQADDPASARRIARDSREDLAGMLSPIPVAVLEHLTPTRSR